MTFRRLTPDLKQPTKMFLPINAVFSLKVDLASTNVSFMLHWSNNLWMVVLGSSYTRPFGRNRVIKRRRGRMTLGFLCQVQCLD